MPIEDTPCAQLLVWAVAMKLVGDSTVLLLAGEVTETPVVLVPVTLIDREAFVDPPHLSHSTITVL
jgi:hypothetical protein